MNEVQELINQIPIKHNLISMIILCGLVQGFLISGVVAFKRKTQSQAVLVFGFLMFILSAILLDVYLCYTGLMKYILHLNDSTEVFVLLLGSMFYFFIKNILTKEKINFKVEWLHFILPIFYVISQMGYYLSPIEMKLNAYIPAFFPELGYVNFDAGWHCYGESIKDEWRWILLGNFLFYIYLITKLVIRHKSKFSESFWKIENDKYGFSKNGLIFFMASFIIIFFVYYHNENDTADHIIALFLSLIIFFTHLSIISSSNFFEKSWVADKYDTSGLQSNQLIIFQKIKEFFEEQKYFLQEDASLKDLAIEMQLPANYISQAINREAQQNFNDFINQYRIEEVKKRLGKEDYAHLNIAGIGKTVGFKSKSAFYAAFKKHTQLTPTDFLKSINN